MARVGFEADELLELLESAGKDTTLKISRRDLAYICGLVLYLFQKINNDYKNIKG